MVLSLRRAAPVLAGLAALALLLIGRLLLPDPAERLRFAVFDGLQRLSPRLMAASESPVRVVDIDDESLRRHGQWPWPRSTVSILVARLQDLGAAAIALDIVFAEADRTSPAGLAESWRAAYGWAPGAADLPDHDRTLAATFARGGVVTGYGLLPRANGARAVAAPSFAVIGPDPVGQLQRFAGAVPNLEMLDAAAAGHGSFTIAAGRDEIVRRLPLLSVYDHAMVPSLSVEALRVAQGEESLTIRSESDAGGTITGHTLRIGALEVPLDREGMLAIHHGGAVAARMIPAWRLLDPDDAATLKDEVAGRIVLVGTSAVGLSDLRPTPLNAFEPGVAVHAEAIEQMVSGQHLVRPAWASGAEILFGALLAVGVVFAAALAPLRLASGFALGLAAACLCGTYLAFTQAHWLLDPSLTLVGLAAGFVATSSTRHLLVERDASRLKTAFTHYLSPDLVAVLARDPDRLRLGGETRPMSFVFTDLEGFTAMTERHGPEALVSLLNRYLDGLCAVAMAHGGTVDKIVGDAVHVMFNAPLDQPDHAARAVACALGMDAFAMGFRDEQRAAGIAFGVTRIGVNTGPALVGNFGGARRFDYTAHGDAINTAARLEAANKTLGTRICVARSTRDACGDGPFRPIATLTLRGKEEGIEVFEPLVRDSAQDEATVARHVGYLAVFARLMAGDASAEADLLRLHEADPADPILALHARRIRAGERGLRIAA